MVVLNWSTPLDGVTLSPDASILVPNQSAPLSLWPSPEPPPTVARLGEYGIYFRLDPADPTGTTFLLADGGLKVAYGSALYRTDDRAANGTLNDRVYAIGQPPGLAANGADRNALNSTTIRLGLGDDRFEIVGRGITQSAKADVSFEASRGFIFRSTIEAGPGDDYLSVLMPWQSIFRGGSNTDYGPTGLNVQISAANPLLAVPYGDTIELKGSRVDWDLEFSDENGDGSVTLASILGEQDAIAISNGNRISGFERLRFGDILLDLVLSPQLDADVAIGQPGTLLFGGAVAPELNSSIGADLWGAFRFNRTRIAGIKGTPASPVKVRTGASDDTPSLQGALAFASLDTEAGRDVVSIGSVNSATVETGVGDDRLEVQGDVAGSWLSAGAGQDVVRFGSIAFSEVRMGADAEIERDVLQVRGSLANSTFWGGGGEDTLILDAVDPATFPLTRVTDETGTYHRYGTNRFYGFEIVGGAGSMAPDLDRFGPGGPGPGGVTTGTPLPAGDRSAPAADQGVSGGPGASRTLAGTPADDVFQYSAARGLAAGDVIRDFEAGSDRILIADVQRKSPIGKALKGKTRGKLLSKVKKSKQVGRSRSLLVYNTKKGELFYNANGSRKGLGGGGGLIADFTPNVKLSHADFLFAYVDPLA
jgi:hypothetical protein